MILYPSNALTVALSKKQIGFVIKTKAAEVVTNAIVEFQ